MVIKKIFKNRNKVLFGMIHGEANSADVNDIENSYSIQFKDHIHLIDPENIQNGDKLGLLWRMQAKSSYMVIDSIYKYG